MNWGDKKTLGSHAVQRPFLAITMNTTMGEKCPNTVFSGPNTVKYRPESTPYLNTFHTELWLKKMKICSGTGDVPAIKSPTPSSKDSRLLSCPP